MEPISISAPEPWDDARPAKAATLQAERNALRIQAAAVAAQQAGLAEQEGKLHQRRKALERQKEQLAVHLEERRQQLLQLREQARQDRAVLKAETEELRRQNEEARTALSREREAVQQELHQVARERRRLIELRKRLKKRWHKHWQAHDRDIERREQALMAERANVEREAEKLQQERVQLMQTQLRFNGEVELERRRLQDEWQQLGLAQQQWETCLNQEQAERGRRLRELNRRTQEVAAAEQKLAEHRRVAEQLQLQLRKEAEGLESRICNQRLKLLDCKKEWAGTASNPPTPNKESDAVALPLRVARLRGPEVPRVLSRLAGDLNDQRRHLLEQWQCLLELQEMWIPERSAIIAQFEAAARELVQVEQRLSEREQILAGGEMDLRQRQQVLFDVRCSLEAWQARLTARETFLDNERLMVLADARAREQMAESQARRLEEIRQRRARRRSQEIEELRVARVQHEQMRRDYALLWQECQDRRAELVREQRALAAKALALEQFRQELMGRVIDAPGADKRLERLRRRNLARIQTDERDLQRERAALMGETKRLDLRDARLIEQEEKLLAQHEDWMKEVAEWEDRQEAATELEQHRRLELRHWQLLHERDERELIKLREEVEQIARLLLDENESVKPSLAA